MIEITPAERSSAEYAALRREVDRNLLAPDGATAAEREAAIDRGTEAMWNFRVHAAAQAAAYEAAEILHGTVDDFASDLVHRGDGLTAEQHERIAVLLNLIHDVIDDRPEGSRAAEIAAETARAERDARASKAAERIAVERGGQGDMFAQLGAA